MRRKSGKEMRNLILAVSISTLLLVLAIIAFFMISIIVTTNDNIEHNKEAMIETSLTTLKDMGENITQMGYNMELLELFKEDIIESVMIGDMETLDEVVLSLGMIFYPLDYLGVIRGGEVTSYSTKGGEVIETAEMPTSPPEGDHQVLDKLGDREGFFISVVYPMDLSIVGLEEILYVNLIIDRTAELAAIEDYFNDQRNDLILMLSIASIIAIILTILLTTLGLRYFTNKYVVRPIEELKRTAQEITEGTFKGEVQVDKDSAYAALQGLLRSGQKVLSRLDEEMRE